MSLKDRLSEPGFIVSAAVHVGALAATLVAFSQTPKFDDIQETVPVEVVTDNQFNEIMRGEKTAKAVRPEALAKAEQVAPVTETQPDPPTPDQSRDSQPPPPPPPPPLPPVKQVEPVKPPTEVPPPPVAVLPPPRPEPPEPDAAPAVPTPPVRDVAAEPVAPKVQPKPVPKPVVKPVPTPVPHPIVKVHDNHPPPKFKPVDKPKLDQVARLMDEQAPTDTTPAPRPPVPKTKPAPDPAPESKFDLTDITKLLSSHEEPAQRPSTGHDISHLASLGSPTASAAKMSPSLWAGLDGLLEDQYRACWSYLGLTSGKKYIPQVRVVFAQNGGLEGDPVLINPPADPALQSLADSALRAVRRCNPLKIPDQYAPFYDQWRGRVLRFDPEEMAG